MSLYVSRVSKPYWEAIPQDEREAISDAIPEGHRLVITPGHRGKPGTADIALRTEDNQSVRTVRGYITGSLVRSVLPRLVVTTDVGGWIADFEETA